MDIPVTLADALAWSFQLLLGKKQDRGKLGKAGWGGQRKKDNTLLHLPLRKQPSLPQWQMVCQPQVEAEILFEILALFHLNHQSFE